MLRLFWALFPGCRPTALRSPPSAVTVAHGADLALTAEAAALLRTCGCPALADRVAVGWNRRFSTTAGLAHAAEARVSLNPRLRDFPGETDRTLRHELAHLLAAERARGQRRRVAAHGPEWRRACADLGIPGETRCHDLPLPRRQIHRRHVYRCPRCAQELHRARPVDRRRRRLACSTCCQQHAGGRFDARFEFVKVR